MGALMALLIMEYARQRYLALFILNIILNIYCGIIRDCISAAKSFAITANVRTLQTGFSAAASPIATLSAAARYQI